MACVLAAGPALASVSEPEPNGSQASPASITGGQDLVDFAPNGVVVVNGTLTDGDIDSFSFGVRNGEPVTLALFEEARGELDDTQIVLFDGSGVEIARNDDGGPGFFSRIAPPTPTAGDVWTVAVTRFPDLELDGDPGAAFSYSLVVAVNGPEAVLDADASPGPQGANDLLATAQPLPAGDRVVNGGLQPGDADIYSFTAGVDSLILVSVFDNAAGERNDSILRLYHDGTPVPPGDDDGGPHFLSNLVHRVGAGEAGGTWQLEVSGFVKSPGAPHEETFDYQLVVANGAAAAPPPTVCDVNGDSAVDRTDIDAIFAARNTPASGPDDPRDWNGDGVINVLDSRGCTLDCDNPGCAPTVPLCGLLGPEALLVVLPLAWRRARRLTRAGYPWHRGGSDPGEECGR
jgi:hypothetical protein